MYDLENKSTLETIAGAEYRNCCWKLRLLSQRELVDDDGDGVERSELDAWQRFAHDIVVESAEKRDAEEFDSVGDLRGYKPLRLLVSGSAGTGKSKTLRAFVRGRRAVRKKFVKPGDTEAVKQCCVLGAPTGCASFHMKYGATTVHRAFGVRVGFCGPWNKQGAA